MQKKVCEIGTQEIFADNSQSAKVESQRSEKKNRLFKAVLKVKVQCKPKQAMAVFFNRNQEPEAVLNQIKRKVLQGHKEIRHKV